MSGLLTSSTVIAAVGVAAGTVTTLCWLPQVVRVLRTRDTAAISLWAYLAFASGVGLWLVYGLLRGDLPLIVANLVTLLLSLAIIGLKLRHG
jgi:MtN3 and saliva related transmembrane protein